MDYPLRKMCIFWHVLKHELSDIKSFFSIQNIKKTFFLTRVHQKNHIKKKFDFLDENHRLTLQKNVVFGTL